MRAKNHGHQIMEVFFGGGLLLIRLEISYQMMCLYIILHNITLCINTIQNCISDHEYTIPGGLQTEQPHTVHVPFLGGGEVPMIITM